MFFYLNSITQCLVLPEVRGCRCVGHTCFAVSVISTLYISFSMPAYLSCVILDLLCSAPHHFDNFEVRNTSLNFLPAGHDSFMMFIPDLLSLSSSCTCARNTSIRNPPISYRMRKLKSCEIS